MAPVIVLLVLVVGNSGGDGGALLVLEVLLLVVVAVRCRKLISTLSWIVGGLFGLFERAARANQHAVVDYWCLFGLFIGSVRRLPAEANQYAVVDVRRPVWLV